MPTLHEPRKLQDYLFDFQFGVNQRVAPLLLPKNQMASALNVTVRGTFATHRPAVRKIPLTFQTGTQTNFETGKWQGGGYYKPDAGTEKLVAVIGGRFFTIRPAGTSGIVIEPPLNAAPPVPYPRPITQRQAWLWQAEKWMIWNDGVSMPVFYDNVDLRTSNYAAAAAVPTTTALPFVVPAVGATVVVQFTAIAGLAVGDVVTIEGVGLFQVLVLDAIAPFDNTLLSITGAPVGFDVPAGTAISWTTFTGTELPPGRMGVYGMGRNWMSLVDGKHFLASDIVGGSSGTQAENYRDAVLNVTENAFLHGGGYFTVPGSIGDIKAMRFIPTLDAALGQGPLAVLTPTTVFSCNAPVDRLTWQDMQNPILTQSLITMGGLSQNATICANGDLLFRSRDGVRSLILARRDFNVWGNVPQSLEVDPVLRMDSPDLLEFSSAVVFDNRYLITSKPVLDGDHGVYWKGLIALNFDPLSSLRGKLASVYDGLWTGLNVFQVITGEFDNVQRCFAFTWNTIEHKIELYEILTDEQANYDNGTEPITWMLHSPVLDFGQKDPRKRELLRLNDGEIHVDQLYGQVSFQVYYKPDQWPCWVPWHSWVECAQEPNPAKPETATYKPQYRPSMGLGQPSPIHCDHTNDRPLREGYSFQVKIVVTGHCRILSARFEAVTIPEPMFSKMTCCTDSAFLSSDGNDNPNV